MTRLELEQNLLSIVIKRLEWLCDTKNPEVTLDTSNEDLQNKFGLDSLDRYELMMFIEDGLKVSIPDVLTDSYKTTFRDVYEYIINSNQI